MVVEGTSASEVVENANDEARLESTCGIARKDGGADTDQSTTDTASSTSVCDSSRAGDPDQLLCPISGIMFRDPVFVPESGNTYERDAIVRQWASQGQTRDPLTGTLLTGTSLHTNWGMRRAVQYFLDVHPKHVPNGWPDRQVPAPLKDKVTRGGLQPRVVAVIVLFVTLIAFARSGLAYFADDGTKALAETTTPKAAAPALSCPHLPPDSRLDAQYHGSRLTVRVPPAGLGREAFGQMCFSMVWLGVTAVWIIGILNGTTPFFVMFFSLLFWGAGATALVNVGRMLFVSEVMVVEADTYSIVSQVFGWTADEIHGLIANVEVLPEVECVADQLGHSHGCQLVFRDSYLDASYTVPELPMLRRVEADWFKTTVEEHLQSVGAS
eukprot:TRINITY_DN9146_c0_g1_i1.p1 TRINITY_DN9146_c0_g1~~TRINITY_DN9146_c0_g1_i1.p1  ORF type:complete len:383 (-),score=32.35 TRINITY_DN9146_c0_g1_i1:181-1329(-)